MSASSFEIQQKKEINGKISVIGSQTVSITDQTSKISIGKNISDNGEPICEIVQQGSSIFLQVSKKSGVLSDLEKYSTSSNEDVFMCEVKNLEMYSNESISFVLANNQNFGKLLIDSNKIIQKATTGEISKLYETKDGFFDVDLPNNIFELIKNEELTLKKSPRSKKSTLPYQIFPTLKNLNKTNQDFEILEVPITNKRSFKAIKFNDRIFVCDGTEFKEVEAGFNVIDDYKTEDKTDFALIIGFDKSSAEIGQAKNSKYLGNIQKSDLDKILAFLPDKFKLKEEDFAKSSIKDDQLEEIPNLSNGRDKIGFVRDFDDTETPKLLEDPELIIPIDPENSEAPAESEVPAEENQDETPFDVEPAPYGSFETDYDFNEAEAQGKPAENHEEAEKPKKKTKKGLFSLVAGVVLAAGAAALTAASIANPIFFLFAAGTAISAYHYISEGVKDYKKYRKGIKKQKSEAKNLDNENITEQTENFTFEDQPEELFEQTDINLEFENKIKNSEKYLDMLDSFINNYSNIINNIDPAKLSEKEKENYEKVKKIKEAKAKLEEYKKHLEENKNSTDAEVIDQINKEKKEIVSKYGDAIKYASTLLAQKLDNELNF